MGYVYILQSLKNGKYYIGSTSDLVKRLNAHNAGHGGFFTKINRPWKLICYKRCDTLAEARKQEMLVKSYKSGNGFQKIINGEVAEWSKAAGC